MDDVMLGPKARTASELKAQQDADRAGSVFVVHREAAGEQRILVLGEVDRPLWVGRRETGPRTGQRSEFDRALGLTLPWRTRTGVTLL